MSLSVVATATLLVGQHSNKTMFGTSALAFTSNYTDPILMTSSWVYDPAEVTGRRPSGQGSWTLNDSAKVQRQMLTVVGGVYSVDDPSTTSVDAVIYWNTKSEGTEGNCSVLAFNGERGPVDGLV